MQESTEKKAIRHKALRELITQNAIDDQETLVTLMKRNYGINTSQSIISRDLRALGVVKRTVANKHIYELPQIDASQEIIRLAVMSVAHNESMIVIRTKPGTSDFVGDYLDAHENVGILGTISGENTLFVAPIKVVDIAQVHQKICSLLYIKGVIDE